MKILGIDPGYERLGIAILEKNKGDQKEILIHSECFKTSSKLDFNERLLILGKKVEEIIKEYKPEMLSIETLFLNTNQKTVMQVAEVRGIIIYLARKYNLKIFEASPPQIKSSITGYGKSDKEQIRKMVGLLINLPKEKSESLDDELDAIAIALTAFANTRI